MQMFWTVLVVITAIISSRAPASLIQGERGWFTILLACLLPLVAACLPARFRGVLLRMWLLMSGVVIVLESYLLAPGRPVVALVAGVALCVAATGWRYWAIHRERSGEPDQLSVS